MTESKVPGGPRAPRGAKEGMSAEEIRRTIVELEEEMLAAADDLRFEYAAKLRDEIKSLRRELDAAEASDVAVEFPLLRGLNWRVVMHHGVGGAPCWRFTPLVAVVVLCVWGRRRPIAVNYNFAVAPSPPNQGEVTTFKLTPNVGGRRPRLLGPRRRRLSSTTATARTVTQHLREPRAP